MRGSFRIFISVLSVLLLASCFSWDKNIHKTKVDELSSSPVTALMQERATYIKERVFSKCTASGVFISTQGMTLYAGRTGELAKRVLLLGFTDAFLLFDTNSDHATLTEFSTGLSNAGINVWLYIDSPRLYAGDKILSGMIKSTVDFCATHPEIKGILIYQRPDLITGPAKKYTSNILFSWDDESYGKGLDNDLLMKSALDIDAKFRKALPPRIEIMQMISPFYENRIKDGSLSAGSTADFMKICSKLCIAAYFSDRFQIAENIELPLKNASAGASIFVAVRTYVDIYGGADKEQSLSNKSWFKLVKDLENIANTAKPFKSFRGIAFYDYYGLEKMWEKLEAEPAAQNNPEKAK